MKVLSINQNPIVNVEESGFFDIKGTVLVVDLLKYIVDVVVHSIDLIEAFFCSGGGEFVVVIEVYVVSIKVIKTSVEEEFVGSGSCRIIGQFCKRAECLPARLPILGLEAEVMLKCLDGSFTESICVCIVGSSKV